jgi:hypothetical protein
MKAYIVTYLFAAFILSMICAGGVAAILAAICFVTWSLPAVVPYGMFRAAIVTGFVTAMFYIRSPEGKIGVRSVEAIWK